MRAVRAAHIMLIALPSDLIPVNITVNDAGGAFEGDSSAHLAPFQVTKLDVHALC
jgi:hypothetical protein